jgi:hypothetical protein
MELVYSCAKWVQAVITPDAQNFTGGVLTMEENTHHIIISLKTLHDGN